MRARKLLSLKNEDLLSHKQLIPGDTTLWKNKQTNKHQRITILRKQQQNHSIWQPEMCGTGLQLEG